MTSNGTTKAGGDFASKTASEEVIYEDGTVERNGSEYDGN